MRARSFAFLLSFCAAIAFACVAFVAPMVTAGARVDVSTDQRNSLSSSTLQALRGLRSPATVTLHVGPTAFANNDDVARVRAVLTEAARVAGPRLAVRSVITRPDSALPPMSLSLTPLIGAERRSEAITGADAEAALAALLQQANPHSPPHIALITTLPTDVESDDPTTPSTFAEIARDFRLTILSKDFSAISSDVDVLAILHPWVFTPAQSAAVLQFAANRGKVFVALDPAFLGAADLDRWRAPAQTPDRSSLTDVLRLFGLALTPDVVLDLDGALPVQRRGPGGEDIAVPQPLYWRAAMDPAAGINDGVNVAASGAVVISSTPGVQTKVLARSSGRTGRMVAFEALQRPSVERTTQSSFDQGETALAVRARRDAAHGGGAAIVIADADFLFDRYYRSGVGPDQRDVAGNAAFVLQAIRDLAGGDAEPAAAPTRKNSGDDRATTDWRVWLGAAVGPVLIVVWGVFLMRRRRR